MKSRIGIARPGFLADLPRRHFGAVLIDPPWRFRVWNKATAVKRRSSGTNVSAAVHYATMPVEEIAALPVTEVAADDCALFLWACWPMLEDALRVIHAWGFTFKTCAFDWTKVCADRPGVPTMGMGYWTRANSEPCLLATRGHPKRLSRNVKMSIIEPRREHSRKPACVHDRIERLVAGPYLELFARERRHGWTSVGDQLGKFDGARTFTNWTPSPYLLRLSRYAKRFTAQTS